MPSVSIFGGAPRTVNIVLRETFTGDGSDTTFQLTSGIGNCTFDKGAWAAAQVETSYPAHVTGTDKAPTYDSTNLITRNRIGVSSIDGDGLVTLDYAPRSGVSFYIWYWYTLSANDEITYYREDFVASMEEQGAVIAGGITVDVTNFNNLLSAGDSTVQAALETIDDFLTSSELSQLQNIGATTISAAQWGYVGAMNQGVATGDSPSFSALSLGTGELTCGSINRASGTLSLEIGGTSFIDIASGSIVINEGGANVGLRIEASGQAYAIYMSGSTGAVTLGAGLLNIGTNDSIYGQAFLYGNGTGSSAGGAFGCYTAADYDTYISNYYIKVFQDDLLIGPVTDAYGTIKITGDTTANEYVKEVVINEGGYDIDFRVEAVGVASAFFVQGSDGNIFIGKSFILPASEYVNFGGVQGADSYGLRDNAGAVEYKDSGGAWTPLNTVATGGVTTFVSPFSNTPTAGQGTWTYAQSSSVVRNAYFYNTSHTDGDNCTFTVYLGAGTYTFNLQYHKMSGNGIVDIYVDGSEEGSVDMYGSGYIYNYTIAGLVLTAGSHTFKFQLDGKNESANNYYAMFSEFTLVRTA